MYNLISNFHPFFKRVKPINKLAFASTFLLFSTFLSTAHSQFITPTLDQERPPLLSPTYSGYTITFATTDKESADFSNYTIDDNGNLVQTYYKYEYAIKTGILEESRINTDTYKNPINGYFVNLTNQFNTGDSSGGALNFTKTGFVSNILISEINADFINNSTSHESNSLANQNIFSKGGAIYNNGNIENLNGDFIGNSATLILSNAGVTPRTQGGAIYNDNLLGTVNGNFVGNYTHAIPTNDTQRVVAEGGAVYNYYEIKKINGSFINNYALGTGSKDHAYGGAIYNLGDIFNGIDGDFIGNYAKGNYNAHGGAIFNYAAYAKIGTLTSNFVDNRAISDRAMGGAIYNDTAKMGNIIGDFYANYSYSSITTAEGVALGGAINNQYRAEIGDITGNFVGNYSIGNSASGGAIYNSSPLTLADTKIGVITGDFIQNYAQSNGSGSGRGGAIENDSAYIEGIYGNFFDNYAKSIKSSYGGAIYNTSFVANNPNSKIRVINADFIGNRATSETGSGVAGAIYNGQNTSIDEISGNFTNNYASTDSNSNAASAGAIFNAHRIGKITDSNFTNNYAIANNNSAEGGAILNYSQIDIIEANFIDNYAQGKIVAIGGAISTAGTINKIEGLFKNNRINASEVKGGALSNQGTIADLSSSFHYNYANGTNSVGGAISNEGSAKITNLIGDFIGNHALGTETAFGGAISNLPTLNQAFLTPEITNITGTFSDNYAEGKTKAYGGAIHNYGTIKKISDSLFSHNHVYASDGEALGGALTASTESGIWGVFEEINNTSFINNYAKATGSNANAKGGAIYSNTDIRINADNATSTFSGNYIENNGVKESNAIYMKVSVDPLFHKALTLNTSNNGKIIFNDGIDGDEGYVIKITGDSTGNVDFNNNIKNALIITDASNIVNIAQAKHLNHNNSLTLNNGVINILDFGITSLAFNRLDLNGGLLNVYNVEANLSTFNMGSISSPMVEGDVSDIRVKSVKVKTDGNELVTYIPFTTQSLIASQIASEVAQSSGPVYNYDVDYNPETGEFRFTRREGEFNPEVLAPSIAAVAAASVLSDEIYSRVLANIDTPCRSVSCARKVSNAWVKSFSSDDSIDLKNFKGADTQFSGIIAGIESDRINEGKGISAVYTAYGAYANGEQKFSAETINQDAWYLGIGATFYKGNGFLGTTANIATVRNEAKTFDGKDKFNSYLGGVAFKTGYNYEVFSLIVQPNLYGSYTYINSDDYITKGGADIAFSDMAFIELAPGIKISKELEDNLITYFRARYVHTFNQGQDVYANNILLPEITLKPYVEYGIGVEKNLNKYSGFAEIIRRDGGREGWNGLIGLKYNW